jgi:hypothetical protein
LHGRGPPVKLPTLSIAARLYAIFALMAATTVALSAYAVSNARFHAALTENSNPPMPAAGMSNASTG